MKPKSTFRRFFPLSAIMMAGALCAPVASAAIVVQNTAYDFINSASSATSETISGFALSGGTKLVVTTGTEAANASGITFAGQALTSIVIVNNGVQQASIWYLDNPTATVGDIIVTYTSGTNKSLSMAALSVSGAATGVLDSAGAAANNSGTLTIDAGSLVVGSFVANFAGSLINPVDPSTDIYSTAIWDPSGTYAAAAYFIEPDPASRTSFGFTGGSTSRPVAVAASFAAIPEPAAALLGGIGLLMLLRRRRR